MNCSVRSISRSRKSEPLRILLALVALGLGFAVYLLDRPAGTASLVPFTKYFADCPPYSFGSLGNHLPDFAHVFAIALFTLVAIGAGRQLAVRVCVTWWVIDSLFEIGQLPALAPHVVAAVPTWFQGIPVLENARAYFLHGTFDVWDMVAIAAGAIAAYTVIALTDQATPESAGLRIRKPWHNTARGLALSSVVVVGLLSILGTSGGGDGGGGLPVTMTLTATSRTPIEIDLAWAPDRTPTSYSVCEVGGGASCFTVFRGTSVVVSGTPATRYCYIVYASYFPFGALERSNEACVTTPPNSPPTPPGNATASAVSPARVDLSWTASADDYGVSAYRIYRDGTFIRSATATSFSDTGLDPSRRYCYTISATDGMGGESAPGAPACATTAADTVPPTAPDALRAIFDQSGGATPTVNLAWDASPDNGVVRGYKVYRDGLHITDTTTTSHSDTGLEPYTQYCYTVSAFDAAGNESALSSPACATTSWAIATVDTQVDVQWTAIALDSSDRAFVSYYDGLYTGSNQQVANLKYATNLTGTWTSQVIDNVAPTVYASTDIAADSTGAVHITYYHFSPFHLKYATNGGGSWATSIIDPNALNVSTTSVAVDSMDKVHVTYNAYPSGLIYTTNSSGAWMQEVVVSGTYDNSIAVDAPGRVHIAYLPDYTAFDLAYATNASGTWVTETIESAGDVGTWNSIAVDTAGKVHISYYDSTNRDLKYATNTSGAWVTTTVDSEGDVGTSTSIAADSAGKVHISYTDDTNHDLKYATNASGEWKTYSIDSAAWVGGLFSGPGGYTSIAVDSTDSVHITYRGNTDLKYATNRPR